MKIALCISGQPRSVAATFPFIDRHIIQPNQPDVFIHSWIDDNIKGHIPIAANGLMASDVVPHDIEEVILRLYKPTTAIFEPQRRFDEKDYNERKETYIKPKNSLSQRYSIQKSIELATQHSTYDIIIRMRFDFAIRKTINAANFPLDKITTPNDCPWPGGINDQFAIGNQANMVWYSNLFDAIDDLYHVHNLSFCDEVLLAKHLSLGGIETNPVHIPYTMYRCNGASNERYVTSDYINDPATDIIKWPEKLL